MKALEAAERLQKLIDNNSMKGETKKALQVAIEALGGNPCAVCAYSPPMAGYDKPCINCPAVGQAISKEDV